MAMRTVSRLFQYIGPEHIRAHAAGRPAGKPITAPSEIERWLEGQSVARPRVEPLYVSFVVDADGFLRLADRHVEHVQCAGGGAVLARVSSPCDSKKTSSSWLRSPFSRPATVPNPRREEPSQRRWRPPGCRIRGRGLGRSSSGGAPAVASETSSRTIGSCVRSAVPSFPPSGISDNNFGTGVAGHRPARRAERFGSAALPPPVSRLPSAGAQRRRFG